MKVILALSWAISATIEGFLVSQLFLYINKTAMLINKAESLPEEIFAEFIIFNYNVILLLTTLIIFGAYWIKYLIMEFFACHAK